MTVLPRGKPKHMQSFAHAVPFSECSVFSVVSKIRGLNLPCYPAALPLKPQIVLSDVRWCPLIKVARGRGFGVFF